MSDPGTDVAFRFILKLMADPLRILVIDDDPVMRELLEMLLELSGHAVTIVDSGNAALEYLASGAAECDVVLTDLHMPGLHGEELAGRLQAARPAGALLVGMSGSAPSPHERTLLDCFLQKPFTLPQFESLIEAARAGGVQMLASTYAGASFRSGSSSESAGVTRRCEVNGELNENVFQRLKAALPPEQLRELFLLTIEDVLNRVELMRAAGAAGDIEAARREAHAIKGGSGMVGAAELYHLATQSETAEDSSGLNLDAFAPACERLKRMLDARLKFNASQP